MKGNQSLFTTDAERQTGLLYMRIVPSGTLKNLMDFCIGTVMFILVGFSLL